MLGIETLHHVSVPVSDLEESKRFYAYILGLKEIDRPDFPFPGAWYAVGDGHQLHLIQDTAEQKDPTFRAGKGLDSRDIHFAIRVQDYDQALKYLESKGYSETAEDERKRLKVNRTATAGFPQIYLLDPDRNMIEINAAPFDSQADVDRTSPTIR